jgi:hypothetical protein
MGGPVTLSRTLVVRAVQGAHRLEVCLKYVGLRIHLCVSVICRGAFPAKADSVHNDRTNLNAKIPQSHVDDVSPFRNG